MMFRLVRELTGDLDRPVRVAVACRVLEVSASGYHEWLSRPASARDVADAHLLDRMIAIHAGSRGTYGARRVNAERRLAGPSTNASVYKGFLVSRSPARRAAARAP
jgi:hypothetical protein